MGSEKIILFCFGSRPELIKISPVYQKLKALPGVRPLLCATGQQKDLLSPHMKYLGIVADYALDVMRRGQTLEQLLMHLFKQLPHVFDRLSPDMVIIQGDTASAMASAIVAAKKFLPIAHIEAGLRTYDRESPFPEEICRQNISTLAQWHFSPTDKARQNLLREGVHDKNIFVTGNTSVDMILRISKNIRQTYGKSDQSEKKRPYFLITLHRRESQGSPLMRIITCLTEFAANHPEFDFIVPLHPNPASSKMIKARMEHHQNIRLAAPLIYPEFTNLMAGAFAIITDSGGIQEEAPSLNVPVIVVRDKTERSEGVENGCLRLAGTEKNTILTELNMLINDKAHYKKIQQAPNPFGDGFASDRIAAHLMDILGQAGN